MDERSGVAVDCDAIKALIPAFSLGATDPDETALVMAHLNDCPEAAAELAAYADLASTMLFSAPAMQPPTRLADRLRAATTSTAPAKAERGAPSLWQRLAAALAAPQRRPALAIAVVALALLMAVSVLATAQLATLRRQQQDLIARLEQQAALLSMVAEDDFLRIQLPAGPAGQAAGAYATVLCNPAQAEGLILAESLPPLPTDQTYQVWLIKDNQRVSGGLLQPDSRGASTLLFRAPEPMGAFDAIGITQEPAGGSPAPTSPPVIKGNLYTPNYDL